MIHSWTQAIFEKWTIRLPGLLITVNPRPRSVVDVYRLVMLRWIKASTSD